MERTAWLVVLCAVIGVSTACDQNTVDTCRAALKNKYDSIRDIYIKGGMNEKKFHQKRCRELERFTTCVTPALSGCPRDIINSENEFIKSTENGKCERFITVAMGTTVETTARDDLVTFPTIAMVSATPTMMPTLTVTRGRHDGTTDMAATKTRESTSGLGGNMEATARDGLVTYPTIYTVTGGRSHDGTPNMANTDTDLGTTAMENNQDINTEVTGATTVSMATAATRGAGSGVVMAGMVTMVTVCVYE